MIRTARRRDRPQATARASPPIDSRRMYPRDRLANVLLLLGAVGAWVGVWYLFTTRSPTGDQGIQAVGALLLGAAVALTTLPLYWLAVFARRRIAYRGDWLRATRRALLTGSVVTLLVALQVLGASSLPLVLFVVAMAGFVELILTARS